MVQSGAGVNINGIRNSHSLSLAHATPERSERDKVRSCFGVVRFIHHKVLIVDF